MSNRREFLKKALKVGAVAGVGAVATTSLYGNIPQNSEGNGVARGKSKKGKEVLYWESEAWRKYYKIAY